MCYLERLDEVVAETNSDLDRIEDRLHRQLLRIAGNQTRKQADTIRRLAQTPKFDLKLADFTTPSN